MNFKQILALTLSFNLIFNNLLLAASIEVDTSAAASNQASLDTSASGIQVVNIVNPNSKGTSHNKFKTYNVNSTGLILNNSKVIVNTQLAGQVSFNPNLVNNASLILNEVTGTSKTLLNGYTEVAGVRADVIVANPNGITVNGGGFINTNKAVLTTGSPSFQNGFLNGFNINQGSILIEGTGFNTSNISKVELYSKALSINAAFHADNLNVVTGDNFVDLDSTVTTTEIAGSGLSIDSSALGGIYANVITLTSSDTGVGVNLPPEVLAQDSLTLTADGNIVINKLIADNSITAKSSSDSIDINNKVFSKDVSLIASKDINIKEDSTINLTAQDNLTLKATNLNNKAYIYSGYDVNLATINTAASSNIEATNIVNDGLIAAYNLDITSDSITNNGALYAQNDININAKVLDNFETIRSNNDINLLIQDTLTNSKMIYSDGDLTIAANANKDKINTITNTGTIQSGKSINLYAKTLNNQATTPTVNSTTTTTSTKTGGGNNYDLINTTTTTQTIDINTINPALILADADITIDVTTLNNIYSLIASNKNIVLNADQVNNVGKLTVTTKTVVTQRYRNERYCSTSGPSGSCLNHKDRAAYRGTSTSTQTSKTPVINFGIQATDSITGNIVTLNNLSDQLTGSLSDTAIQAKLTDISTIETNSNSLQNLNISLTDNNQAAVDILNNKDDIDTLAAAVITEDDLVTFKEKLDLIKDTLNQNIIKDQETITSLETVITYLKTQNDVSDASITNLENSVDTLKTNITTNLTNLDAFQAINDAIVLIEDVDLKKQDLKDLDTNINNVVTSSTQTLSDISSNNYVATLVTDLEGVENTLRDEINVALDLQENIVYKVISSDEGLYQTNTTTSTTDATVTLKSDPTAVISTIFVPQGDFGIFVTNTDPNHAYLIEQNPIFTDYNTFIGSDYMMDKLNLKPEQLIKKLGDSMYETNRVRDLVIKSTGNRYLDGFTSDNTQFQALMDNAVSLHEDLNLSFGISLSKEQVALLSKDIVWMEERVVQGEIVLVPQLYLASKDAQVDGAKITAKTINLTVSEDVTNDGIISAEDSLTINAQNIINQDGTIKSEGTLDLIASNDLNNLSGTIQSTGDLTLTSGNNINNTTTSSEVTTKLRQGSETLTKKGKTSQIISDGNINITADNDIESVNANIIAKGDVKLVSTHGDIKVVSIESKSNSSFNFENGYSKSTTLTNLASKVEGKNVSITANNLEVSSSNITADETLSLSGVKDIQVLAKNDVNYTDTKITTSSGFMGSKSTRDMSYKENIVSSALTAKNITMNSDENIILEAANLSAQENITIEAKKDIVVTAKQYREGELHSTSKSSWGGLKKSASMDKSDALNLKEATLQTRAQSIILKSQNDIQIIASNINSAANTELEAANEVLISAGNEYASEEKWSKSSTFNIAGLLNLVGIDAGPLYELDYKLVASSQSTAKSSTIQTGSDLIIKAGNTKVVGSNINTTGNLVATTDIGSIEILTAQESKNTQAIDKKIEVKLSSLADMLKSLVPKKEESKLKITLAQASYDKVDSSSRTITNKSSNINSEADINLNSIESITVEGSNLEATNDITLSATQNITIKEAIDQTQTNTKETHAQAEVSVTVQNEYVEAAKAVSEVATATKQLQASRREHKQYKSDVKDLENRLTTLKKQFAANEVGIDSNDIAELSEIISDVKSDEKYYLASIAASVLNLTSKTTLATQQIATAGESSGTYGFSAGISLDVEGSKSKSSSTSTTSLASNIKANNITLRTNTNTNNQTNISGSKVEATDTLTISTKDLHGSSSVDTTTSNTDSKDISGSVSMTIYGAASGPQVSLGYGEQHSESDSLTNTNSELDGNNINITTSNDANFKGVTVKATDTLTLNIGNDLNIESQRDVQNSNSNGFNISGGFGLGANEKDVGQGSNKAEIQADQANKNSQLGARTGNGEVASVNGAFGANEGRVKVKETVLTSLTGNTVQVTTANNTNLKGSLLASGTYDETGKLIDNDNLTLNTKTLTYTDSSNTAYQSKQSFNIGASLGISADTSKEDKEGDTVSKISSSTLQYANNSGYTKSKTLATLGTGNINITDTTNSDDTDRLNRDTTNTAKDLFTVDRTKGNIDLTLDNRLLSEDGRKQITEDVRETGQVMQSIDGILPSATNDNEALALAGRVLNTLNTITLGIIPSDDSDGGIIAQIPVLLGQHDRFRKVVQVKSLSKLTNENKDNFIPIKESVYYKNASDEVKIKLDSYNSLYVSLKPITIDTQSATYQNSTNGMMNTVADAINNGITQSHAIYDKEKNPINKKDDQSNNINLTVNYNPTHGLLGDGLESAVDKFGGTTGMAEQTGEFQRNVTTARAKIGSNFTNHSQANALTYAGFKYIQNKGSYENGGFKPKEYFINKKAITVEDEEAGLPTVAGYGSPMSVETMTETLEGENAETSTFKFIGNYSNENDWVAEGLGNNKAQSEESTLLEKLNPINAGKLFTDESPHSNYNCNDLEGAKCGDRP